MAFEAAERLFENSPDHPRTMTAFTRLPGLFQACETKEDKAAFATQLQQYQEHGLRLRTAMSERKQLSMDEWAEALNSGITTKQDICTDLASTTERLRHDTLVRIEKKLVKAGNAQKFQEACRLRMPLSEHFNK